MRKFQLLLGFVLLLLQVRAQQSIRCHCRRAQGGLRIGDDSIERIRHQRVESRTPKGPVLWIEQVAIGDAAAEVEMRALAARVVYLHHGIPRQRPLYREIPLLVLRILIRT